MEILIKSKKKNDSIIVNALESWIYLLEQCDKTETKKILKNIHEATDCLMDWQSVLESHPKNKKIFKDIQKVIDGIKSGKF